MPGQGFAGSLALVPLPFGKKTWTALYQFLGSWGTGLRYMCLSRRRQILRPHRLLQTAKRKNAGCILPSCCLARPPLTASAGPLPPHHAACPLATVPCLKRHTVPYKDSGIKKSKWALLKEPYPTEIQQEILRIRATKRSLY